VSGFNGKTNGNGKVANGQFAGRDWRVEIHLAMDDVIFGRAVAATPRQAVEAVLARNGIHPPQVSGVAASLLANSRAA
jgi:hypothetical protein